MVVPIDYGALTDALRDDLTVRCRAAIDKRGAMVPDLSAKRIRTAFDARLAGEKWVGYDDAEKIVLKALIRKNEITFRREAAPDPEDAPAAPETPVPPIPPLESPQVDPPSPEPPAEPAPPPPSPDPPVPEPPPVVAEARAVPAEIPFPLEPTPPASDPVPTNGFGIDFVPGSEPSTSKLPRIWPKTLSPWNGPSERPTDSIPEAAPTPSPLPEEPIEPGPIDPPTREEDWRDPAMFRTFGDPRIPPALLATSSIPSEASSTVPYRSVFDLDPVGAPSNGGARATEVRIRMEIEYALRHGYLPSDVSRWYGIPLGLAERLYRVFLVEGLDGKIRREAVDGRGLAAPRAVPRLAAPRPKVDPPRRSWFGKR